VLQGSYGFGSERGVMGAGSGIAYQSDRGAEPVVRSRGLDRRVLEARTGSRLQDAGAGLTVAPGGVERDHVRILAALTARVP
jgi:hypothetical protein